MACDLGFDAAGERLNVYLARFDYGRNLDIRELWAEMDRVWSELGLDNRKRLNYQRVVDFYAHPVWVLNGLFSELDPVSFGHRQAIARYVLKHFGAGPLLRTADVGGGSGVLACEIADAFDGRCRIDIVEPFPSEYFRRRLALRENIQFCDSLSAGGYDVVIAQDVLEHVDQPITLALACVGAVRVKGLVLFANCFYPFIQCHIPGTFYLRHTFRYVLESRGLTYLGTVPGAAHVQVYRRTGEVDSAAVRRRDRLARIIGPGLNHLGLIRRRFLHALRRENVRS